MRTSVKNAVIGMVVSAAVAKGADVAKANNDPVCYPVGDTGYIDYLQPWMLNASVMLGEDRSGRPFVAIRYKGKSGETVVETLHQRYTDSSSFTSAGGWQLLGDHPRLTAEGTESAWLHLQNELENIEFV